MKSLAITFGLILVGFVGFTVIPTLLSDDNPVVIASGVALVVFPLTAAAHFFFNRFLKKDSEK